MSRYDIFISYRRESGKNYARILKPELEKRGFQDRIFLDFDENRRRYSINQKGEIIR
jgi:hypothetical protein